MDLRIIIDDTAAALSPQAKQAAILLLLVQQYKQENPRMTDAFIARQFNIPTSTVKSILGKKKRS